MHYPIKPTYSSESASRARRGGALCFQLGNSARKPAPCFAFRSHRGKDSSSPEVGISESRPDVESGSLQRAMRSAFGSPTIPSNCREISVPCSGCTVPDGTGNAQALTHVRRFTATSQRIAERGRLRLSFLDVDRKPQLHAMDFASAMSNRSTRVAVIRVGTNTPLVSSSFFTQSEKH